MTEESQLQAAGCDLVSEVARISGSVQLKVAGLSMVPVLWPGDLVTIRSCSPSDLQSDWIIVFRQHERLVIHRFIRRVGNYVVTRGDARPHCDEPVSAVEVLGRVESVLRNGRQISFKPSHWQSLVAFFLRRSDRCTRLFLRLSCRLHRVEVAGATLGPVNTVGS